MKDGGDSEAEAQRERRRVERERRTAEWDARLAQLRPLPFEDLTEIVESGVGFDRALAVEAIGEKDDERVAPLLLDVLERTEDDDVRNRAALALYDIGDQRAFEPLLRTIRRLYRGQGGVGTLLFALLPLDARGALADAARILCDDTDASYESAWAAFDVIQHMRSPLPAEAYREALTMLNASLAARGHPDWKQIWLEFAIEHIERCGDDREHHPDRVCSICLLPVAVGGNDPVGIEVLPRYWLARTDDERLETYVCHEACLLSVLHPDARAVLTRDLAELNAADGR